MTDRVMQYDRADPVRSEFAQGQAERRADAAAHYMEAMEPEMVRQCQMITGLSVPIVARVDAGARAAGIALIHRDDLIFFPQYCHRVHPDCGRGRPPESKPRA